MKPTNERPRRRARERGAAMVEGAVVLPMLTVFFGVMMFVHNVAMTKLEIRSETRNAAFSSAAHACIGSGSFAERVGVPSPPIPMEANPPDAEKDASLQNTYIETKANETKAAIALGRSQVVRAESSLYCNPHQFGMNLLEGWVAANMGAGWGLMKMVKFVKWALTFVPLWGRGLL